MAKKLLAVLIVFFLLLVSTTSVSFAQIQKGQKSYSPQYDANLVTSYRAAIDDDGCMTPSLECLVHQVFRFASLEFVNSTLYTEMKPSIDQGNSAPESLNPNNPSQVGTSNKNLLSGIGSLIGNFYAYPAANTQTYIADVLDSAHITPKAYAQGLGFAALNPILELWKAFRNIAYMFFVVIFIVIGFMIMFRQRIGGQAAITAQQAIPSVIVSLILVTFSYAIAGFMIDLMYLLMFLIIGVFGQTLPDGSQNLVDLTILQVVGTLFRATDLFDPTQNIDLVSNLFGSLMEVPDAVNWVAGVVGGLTLTVVLAIAILIGAVKLFFELLKSYASIVLSVVTSPIVLMMGAIPGKNAVVPWLKDLIGNLLPFPVVLLVLVLFYQFKEIGTGAANEGGFIPPFLIARGQSNAIASLMGLALILALPEIVKDAKKGLVQEGFGTRVFKAATESLNEGWKGGKIPGLGVQVPGARQLLETPLFGSKNSRDKYNKEGGNVLRKGILGGVATKLKPPVETLSVTALEMAKNRINTFRNRQRVVDSKSPKVKPRQSSNTTDRSF